MLDIIEDYMELRDINYGRLDGSMNVVVRQEQVCVCVAPGELG